ncbi:SDR family oxidoreductase [Salinarimonas ramus]|uniref:Short-chain dehydrogenase n=1 Tax=Salinarimonas ramus TaxID=690164 RepID=A0A917V3N4_9HYPH|nr:SDR family oxidoreductase [Salinarimonas ramus]GGK31640.1 short-chain dehydrogenase [Salinarimonas ramus]
MSDETTFRENAARVAEEYRSIQSRIDRADATGASGKGGKEGAMQAGARPYPELPYSKTHQDKPGSESDLDPRPLYDAPFYKGSGKLEGMATIVTGGDSGIGRSVAVLFAREGADVTVVHLAEDEDAEETRRAVEAEGRRCLVLSGDVSDEAFCRFAVSRTLETFGRLDVLVNNAAFQEHAMALEDITQEHFDRTLRTNLRGYFNMTKAAVPHLPYGGSIVNSGSVTGIRGSKSLLDYSMTKGGIHSFTRALAGQLIPRGIRANVVAPGPVWTPLNPADSPADIVETFGGGSKMGRPAQPEELAPAYVFLASPQTASYITGEILPVIGGY